MPDLIIKRDGSTQEKFKTSKLAAAISRAATAAGVRIDVGDLVDLVLGIEGALPSITSVEEVQDAVEAALMHAGRFDIAKAYILYRNQRAAARASRVQKTPDPLAISDYIHASKYARHRPDLGRREVFAETVARVEAMHIQRFPHLAEQIRWAFDMVRAKRVLPSMRSMQFAGDAILKNNARIYNCSASPVDRLDVFGEALFLLLSGCGVGYSVQRRHVDRLPALSTIDEKKVKHHVIEDSIEGWADALSGLIYSFIDGASIEFSYHLIRPAGALLKTSGGRAPGHLKLKAALEHIRGVLKGAQGRKLRPIECHRIMCHAADAVLSGGIRRSAMICLFDLDDEEMLTAKTGNWYETDPWFANANNSAVLKRDEVTEAEFKSVFKYTRQWGEPGFHFVNDYDHLTNPCAEVALYPFLETPGPGPYTTTQVSGWAFCNLCEINAAKLTSLDDFRQAALAATLIGTLQAAYTDLPYLGSVSEKIARRDALLGIGMTGMFDSPDIACNPEHQREIAELIKIWNANFAAQIGINPAARTTLIKPSGTTSLELGCVASGHHPHHARRYIRRVTADELEHVFQAFKAANPHMCVRKPDGKYVIEFPVEAPPGAIVKSDLSAIQFLEMVKSTQQNWVIPGSRTLDMVHNVSNTVTVKPEEWDAVADYLWQNRDYFTGVSLLSSSGDKDYAFAPMEEIKTPADELRWNAILESYKPVDYTSIVEVDDVTNLSGEAACAGGVCEVV